MRLEALLKYYKLRWNKPVIESLVKGALDTLVAQGVKPENIAVENVSGSYELPSACSRYVHLLDAAETC
jgi:6,7-dimethyl-8-ribityllumazine synthase